MASKKTGRATEQPQPCGGSGRVCVFQVTPPSRVTSRSAVGPPEFGVPQVDQPVVGELKTSAGHPGGIVESTRQLRPPSTVAYSAPPRRASRASSQPRFASRKSRISCNRISPPKLVVMGADCCHDRPPSDVLNTLRWSTQALEDP